MADGKPSLLWITGALFSLIIAGCCKNTCGCDAEPGADTGTADGNAKKDTGTDEDGDTDSDTDSESGTDSETGAGPRFPIVFSFDDGMNGFYSEYEEWSYDSSEEAVVLDYSFTEPQSMVWIENNIAAVNWQGADWSGATVVEFRVKTLEGNGSFYLPYMQSGDWFWYSMNFDHTKIGEWQVLTLDLRYEFEGMDVDTSRVLRLGFQVHSPPLDIDAGELEPDASPPPYPEPERVRVVLDSIVVRGPEYGADTDNAV